ncbi:membrane-associated oxidoreductase [Streptomyces sp. NP-1717]|uniref:membrane-associated oxidoreductase n=1 Tax=Streptomyces sp. NP-1717 TaxID=2704470 RepID=UPI001F5DEC57|nr:membrane-associated oxidoreductase [Streptomyces sp. NP-1717]MCI3223411.1 membrane-associated oxidoreductase [Streptomyces sp. NP-1717]
MEINWLTPAERRVWRAFPTGEVVDFRTEGDRDPALGAGWGPERRVRAEVVRAVLLDGPRRDGEIPALRLAGARITGELNLRYATADCAILLGDCFFDEVPNLYGTQFRQLNLGGSALPGLTASAVRVDGVLRLTGCRVRGPVRLAAARVSGALFLDGAEITAAPDPAPAGGPDDLDAPDGAPDGAAGPEALLQLNHATVGDDLWAPGLRVEGQMRLGGASVTGLVGLDDAVLTAPGRTALDAQTLAVGTDLRAARLRVRGRIDLRGARIPGQLNLTEARLSQPGGVALRASSCVVGELWLRAAAPVEGSVNLRRSQLELLHVAPEVWPERVHLDGLTYGTLAPHESAERRLAVLERDVDGYVPYAYEQLTASYRRIGDDAAARTVQLAKQRRQRRGLAWYARLWGHVQDLTVGYGFRPMRAVTWMLSLLAVASAAYAVRRPRPLKADESPDFNPVFYSLDLLLPIIDFGQERAFTPEGGWHQGLSYVLIITGWILATTVIAGVTRAVSRQ